MTGAEKLEDLPSAFLLHLLGADKGGGCTTHTYRGKRMEAAALTSQRMGERSPRGGVADPLARAARPEPSPQAAMWCDMHMSCNHAS